MVLLSARELEVVLGLNQLFELLLYVPQFPQKELLFLVQWVYRLEWDGELFDQRDLLCLCDLKNPLGTLFIGKRLRDPVIVLYYLH